MDAKELAHACIRVKDANIQPPLIALVVPGKYTNNKRVKLGKGKAPLGNIVEWNEDSVIALFNVDDILMWLFG